MSAYHYGVRTGRELVPDARIIDTRHAIMIEADDDLPVLVNCYIQWMTPRAFERTAEFEGF